MVKNLNVLSSIANKDLQTWLIWIEENRFINLNQDISNQKKQLNVNIIHNFFKPFHITSLSALIEEYYINGFKININNTSSYLSTIGFTNFWNSNYDRNTINHNGYANKTYLKLWKIEFERIDSIVAIYGDYYKNSLLKNKETTPFKQSLSELFNNIYNHSSSKVSGFCMVQYYYRKNELAFSICDFGKGIPKVVNTYFEEMNTPTLSNTDALKKAFEKNFTTKSIPRNLGLGLDYIKTAIDTNKGELFLISNNALYNYEPKYKINRITNTDSVYFNGTIIDIKLNTNYFNDKEETKQDIFELF